jgi:hypothetical protein
MVLVEVFGTIAILEASHILILICDNIALRASNKAWRFNNPAPLHSVNNVVGYTMDEQANLKSFSVMITSCCTARLL